MLRSLCPARHLTTPRYNFIFHITLPDNATGSVRSLVPSLCDLSIPFKLQATSAPQSSKTRWPGPGLDQPTEIFHAAAQPAKCSGGIKTTCSITQDALGKGKTAPAPPWLQRRSTHHLYPRREARAKTASPPPTCKARINSHPALAQAHQRRQSYWKVSLIKGLVPVCQSTPQGADNQLFLFYDYLWALVLISLAWITGRRMQKSIKAQCSVMT